MIWGNSGAIFVLIGLFLFGLFYNALISYSERHGYLEGLVSLSVVVGVIVTLAGLVLIDLLMPVEDVAGVVAALCFAASGIPMVVGSLVRYVTRRAAAQRAAADLLRQVADNDR